MVELSSEMVVTDRRRRNSDRRRRTARTGDASAAAFGSKDRTPVERRRQDRRRQIDPTTCERDYSGNEVEFMRAMDEYKRRSGRPFPTWSEVLEVLTSLGYRKVAESTDLQWRMFGD